MSRQLRLATRDEFLEAHGVNLDGNALLAGKLRQPFRGSIDERAKSGAKQIVYVDQRKGTGTIRRSPLARPPKDRRSFRPAQISADHLFFDY